MCSSVEKQNFIKKVERKKHMIIGDYFKEYAIGYDGLNELWYLCRININKEPLEVFDGSKECILDVFNNYVKTGEIDCQILEKDDSI